MIFKQKDSLDGQLQYLEQALQRAPGPERQRYEKELAQVRAGAKGEQETAYHIDFHLKPNPNWAVIHDLRLEWNGRVAQVDHLLIDRFLDIYVVESKSFRTKIRHANGGWERLNFNHWEGIQCPVEQNQRHILVLGDLIEQTKMAPTRLGVPLRPTFFNVVVVQPSCSIIGKTPEEARIYRLDKLVRKIRGEDPSPLTMLKMISADTLHAFAADLVSYHVPAPTPVVSQPNATPAPVPARSNGVLHKCQNCGGPLSGAEANYCRAKSARFAGQILCRRCQGYAPKAGQKPGERNLAANVKEPERVAHCAVCGTGVDTKVVAFCRFNSKRFEGRVLCRLCQVSVAG